MMKKNAFVMSPLRQSLHAWLLPHVHSGFPFVARMQKTYRSPFLDTFFSVTSIFGAEEFYFALMPVLFFGLGLSQLARHLLLIIGVVGIITGIMKDYLCLPRPMHPSIQFMDKSLLCEYGFPSTHTATAVSVPLLLSLRCYESLFHHSEAIHATAVLVLLLLLPLLCSFCYMFSLVAGRIYLGVHSPMDIAGGALVGSATALAWYWYYHQIDEWLCYNSYAYISTLVFGIILIYIYPKPAEPTITFKDTVSFISSCCGIACGTWKRASTSAVLLDAPKVVTHFSAYAAHSGFAVALARCVLAILLRLVVAYVMILSTKVLGKKLFTRVAEVLLASSPFFNRERGDYNKQQKQQQQQQQDNNNSNNNEANKVAEAMKEPIRALLSKDDEEIQKAHRAHCDETPAQTVGRYLAYYSVGVVATDLVYTVFELLAI